MVFSSLVFLCAFLPMVFLLHWVIPSTRVRNGLLIAASLLFYAYGEPVYVLLLLVSALVNYTAACLIGDRKRKGVLAVDVVLNLGILCVFKYTGLIVETINSAAGTGIPVPQLALPVGISFFTFQALSYVVDVYRGKVEAQKNFFRILLYIAFFPQLIAGPIVKYRDISREIEQRQISVGEAAKGLRRFIVGLSKKVLIANAMGAVADTIFAAPQDSVNILAAWLGAVAYLMQIYYDFSGYSDMAIGMGRMFGFHFQENFLHPYGAVNIQDFWHKWHVSLSSWFKEYLYIPLGGNRKGRLRTCINKIIVFFCTGLWHGANWTFVLWGLYHGAFLLLEDFVPQLKKLPRVLGHLYSLIVVCVGFVMFRADTVTQGFAMIGAMFTGFSGTAASGSLVMQQMTVYFIVMLAAALLGMAPIPALAEKLRPALEKKRGATAVLKVLSYAAAVVLMLWCMLRLSGSVYNPFIYFRF